MFIKEIFEHLAQGELRTLAVGGMDDGGILRQNYDKVIPHINMAITEIYKRFPAKMEKVDIQCDPSISEYILHTDYTQSAGVANIKYIMDSVTKPFLGDLLKIECIEGKVINDATNPDSITSDYLSFTVPNPTSELLELTYRAQLPSIDVLTFDIELDEIDLPYAYLSALLNYVGMRMTIGVTNKDGSIPSQAFFGKFEANIMKLHELGLTVTDDTVNDKATLNGWV